MTKALLFLAFAATVLSARAENYVAANDVTWNSTGTNENDSMPLGNGDIAINVWTEQNGDIVLLLAKSDAWSENGQLLKLGRVRVKLEPNPFANQPTFSQTLKLESGEVEVRAGNNLARIWVDASHPAAHVEIQTAQPVQMQVTSEPWRTNSCYLNEQAVGRAPLYEWSGIPDGLTLDADTILPAQTGRVSWCHFNSRSMYPVVFQDEHLESLLPKYPDPLLHRCFGVTMKGEGLTSRDDLTLASTRPARTQRLDLYALTCQTNTPEAWRTGLDQIVASTDAVKINSARKAHEQWWAAFWTRSWIHVSGTPEAEKVSQGYAMQRYMTACAGRGAQPIKFNGSLFTVGHAMAEGESQNEHNHNPDYRAWGASYWNQNDRMLYWPLLAASDYDLLAPWFNMYVRDLPLVQDRTRTYYHHDGAGFIETILFWGLPNVNNYGWNNPGPDLRNEYICYHVQGGLEVLAQMLDEYDLTQDATFAKTSLLPMADGVITYYNEHWQRGPDDKILMAPAQAIETYQKTAVNPTPDIAGVKCILPRLLALPAGLGTPAQRQLWAKVAADLPAIPTGTTAKGKLPPKGHGDPDGKPTILPAQKYDGPLNTENPELYPVFPYRLYGVGKPDLQLARNTFAARLFHFGKCWGQDGIEAAILGLTDEARKVAAQEFTSYGNQRFRWFWAKNNDWIPDMDNGGGGMMTLQMMLLQCDGKRIQLLPAWPETWTADFKLHAPLQTTIEGHVEHGKLTNLKVSPRERAKDIVVVPTLQPDITK